MRDLIAEITENPDETTRMLAALEEVRHPLRLRVMIALSAPPSKSPTALLHLMPEGTNLGSLAYHVRALDKQGLIRETKEVRVRGAIEHFYALTADGKRLLRRLKLTG